MTDKEYQKFKQSIFDWLWKDLCPVSEEMDRKTGRVPEQEFLPKFAEKGLCGLLIPEEYGGKGLKVAQYLPILAETAKIHGVFRGITHMANTTSREVACYARKEQRKEYLPKLAIGQLYLAFGLTEARAGTGRDVRSAAVKKDGHYILNGEKHLITCADYAHIFMIFCCTDQKRDDRSFSTLLVARDSPGFTIKRHERLLGLNGSSHGILTFENVAVPANMVLGNEGEGLEQALGEMEPSRVFVAASSLGVAERALELSLDYAKKRVTFGKAIAEREGVRHYLADMAIDVYALRTMLADAARKIDEGKSIPVEASVCKTFGAEAVCRVTEKALQVFGGIGYTAAYPIERLHREARINLLEEGTLSIQRLVIARTLLGGYSW